MFCDLTDYYNLKLVGKKVEITETTNIFVEIDLFAVCVF